MRQRKASDGSNFQSTDQYNGAPGSGHIAYMIYKNLTVWTVSTHRTNKLRIEAAPNSFVS